jgi:hypothetical protein
MLLPPGFVNVIARYSNVMGHNCQNAVGYSISDPLIQANVDALSDGLAIVYKAQLSTVSQWFGVVVDIGNDGPPLQLTSSSSSGTGSRGGSEPPAQVQGLIKKATGFGGRAFRGRLYIPDLYEDQVNNNGDLNGTALGLLNDIAGAWMDLAGFASASFLAPQLLHPSTAPTEITSMAAEGRVATQRRRFPRT